MFPVPGPPGYFSIKPVVSQERTWPLCSESQSDDTLRAGSSARASLSHHNPQLVWRLVRTVGRAEEGPPVSSRQGCLASTEDASSSTSPPPAAEQCVRLELCWTWLFFFFLSITWFFSPHSSGSSCEFLRFFLAFFLQDRVYVFLILLLCHLVTERLPLGYCSRKQKKKSHLQSNLATSS